MLHDWHDIQIKHLLQQLANYFRFTIIKYSFLPHVFPVKPTAQSQRNVSASSTHAPEFAHDGGSATQKSCSSKSYNNKQLRILQITGQK